MIRKMTRCYPTLRRQLKDIGMDYHELARELGRSWSYVANRMSGKGYFDLGEMRQIKSIVGLRDKPIEEVFDS